MLNKILFVLVICFAVSSCGKDDTNKDAKSDTKDSKTTENIKSEKLEFVMKEFSKSHNDCNRDSVGCSYVSYKYPEILNEDIKTNVNGTIMSYLRDSIYYVEDEQSNKDLNELAVKFFAEYDTIMSVTDGMESTYALDVNSEVISETEDDFTVSVSYYINTGGAHPNSLLKYMVFNKKSGNLMTLEDILNPGYETQLNKLIDGAFRKEKGLSPEDDLTKKGNLFENKITFNNNFTVTNDSLKFYYNNYEIAAYAYGPTEISIPLSDLKEFLKEQ